MTAKHHTAFRIPPSSRLSPASIVLLYALAGSLWIVLGDSLTGMLASYGVSFRHASTTKGILFILATSILLHALIRFLVREQRTSWHILQAAFQSSPDAINIKRLKDGAFLKINSGFERMYGYSSAEAIGRNADQLGLWGSQDDSRRLDAVLERETVVRDFPALFRTREGALFRGTLTAKRVELEGEPCLVTIVRDRTAELEAREEAEKLANYDAETGLPNYGLFMDRLQQAIDQGTREGRRIVIIYISLTGFKAIVDALGHDGGGQVMKAISRQIVAAVRRNDSVARMRHDDFAIMLGGVTSEGDVNQALERLQQLFAMPLRLQGGEFAIPACMGVACFPTDGLTADILIQNAHIAMNQARRAGVTLQFYSEAMNVKAMQRFAIETHMLRAIDEGEFFLCYQPKLAISGRDLAGMEALVRWRKPGEGIIPPDRFIGVAEENGMIVLLGAWILREACRQNRAWQDAGLPATTVSVNISGRQLRENSFVEQVCRTLVDTGLEPRYLDLELTESVLMADSGEIVQKLERLKGVGVSITIDDFGTGYSSLSYLKHLPIDAIKVDRSFVRDIAHDPDDMAIVKAVIAMGHALGLKVIAEGVETGDQLDFLRGERCNQVQGYLFSKPLEAERFADLLGRSRGTEVPRDASNHLPRLDSIKPGVLLANDHPLMPPGVDDEAGSPECVGQLCLPIPPAHPGDNLASVLKRFQTEKGLQVLPVAEQGKVVGILNRSTFLEEHVIGLHGFAFQINHSKRMRDLMAPAPLLLDGATSIRKAAETIQEQGGKCRLDNVCITDGGIYAGIIDVNRFIGAITEINLSLAKGANPLTGLPGNESIQHEINDMLRSGRCFDIAYIDIDNFKPYNDCFGFQKGDEVIRLLGEIIRRSCDDAGTESSLFCAHIGGDDFILICRPQRAHNLARQIIAGFEGMRTVFHGPDDLAAGCYVSTNRRGDREQIPLLSLSIGIVNTGLTPVESYGQLASLSTEVKRLAKQQPGSSIVFNRRIRTDTGVAHAEQRRVA